MDVSHYDTLVFDCDGVILNSNKVKTEAFYKTALPYGKSYAKELKEYHVTRGGISRYEKFKYFITDIMKMPMDSELYQKLLGDFANYVKEGLLNCEIEPNLEELRKQTQKSTWLVASGGDQNELRFVFEKRDIKKFFDGGIYGSPDTKHEILQKELKKGKLSGNSLFIGDSAYDYSAAEKMGMDFVFVTQWTEMKSWEEHFNNKKATVMSSLEELLNK